MIPFYLLHGQNMAGPLDASVCDATRWIAATGERDFGVEVEIHGVMAYPDARDGVAVVMEIGGHDETVTTPSLPVIASHCTDATHSDARLES